MAEHDSILVTGPYIAYQSVGTQFIGGNHTHNYPAPDTPHPTDHHIIEDIDFEDFSSSVSPASHAENTALFCRITETAYREGKAGEVEEALRSACVSAPKLINAINLYEALGYLDTKNLSSKELYDLLNEHFGLPFERRNFRFYRSK